MEKKISWVRRPIAWICTYILLQLVDTFSGFVCMLLSSLIGWMGGLSTVVIVILVVMFGSVISSAIIYSIFTVPALLVSLLDKIYPSNHAVRYYLFGAYKLLNLAVFVYAGIIGAVSGGSLFWYYAKLVYSAVLNVGIMVAGWLHAEERHKESE